MRQDDAPVVEDVKEEEEHDDDDLDDSDDDEDDKEDGAQGLCILFHPFLPYYCSVSISFFQCIC